MRLSERVLKALVFIRGQLNSWNEVADLLETNTSSLGLWRKGESSPSLGYAEKILEEAEKLGFKDDPPVNDEPEKIYSSEYLDDLNVRVCITAISALDAQIEQLKYLEQEIMRSKKLLHDQITMLKKRSKR